MAEKRAPVTIDQAETSKKSSYANKKSNIKDSSSRIVSIAQTFGLDAQLQPGKPEKTLLDRAANREKKRQEQRQKNLEQIVKYTHGFCRDETAGDPDQDWLYRFFDMAQDIHNTSMQKLWAQVLKLEITNPGSTSMKALQVLKDMTPKEAQTLQRAASLACSFGSENSKKLLLGFKTQAGFFSFGRKQTSTTVNLGSFQLPYSGMLLLIELGILLGTELESGEIEFDPALVINYQGKSISLMPMGKGSKLIYYRFSPVGNELCKLLGNKPNTQYYDQLLGLFSQKFTVQSDAKGGSVDQMV
ncbi:TIGR03899 family protein [Vibrio sp. JC009]|uniref:TIGR03899 family protein n=1 Tax=Vibrio sp. JC009 TaxID=2912314 RepID=UPI0023AFB515|nr:TIGR03899 family protein [Vibrio sp. JC009]WED22119.1 TIGR03899 family protein [Vibrio sp. JC009]